MISLNKIPIRLLVIVLIALLGVLIWAFGHYIYDDPTNVFYGMLANNLSTTGITTIIDQTNGTTTSKQTLILENGPYNIATTISDTKTVGSNASEIETQTIGTPNGDYAKYVTIQTTQKGLNGKKLDFSKIVGVWGARPTKKDAGQLYNEAILQRILPFGDLTPTQRSNLISIIKETKTYKITNVKHQFRNGRLEYVYTVEVNPVGYNEMINVFAADLGLPTTNNPYISNLVNTTQMPTFNVAVDVISRQVVNLNFVTASYAENYSSYNAKIPLNIPKKTIPITQLETLVAQTK